MTLGPGSDILLIVGQSNSTNRGVGSFSQSDTTNDAVLKQVGRYGTKNMKIIGAPQGLQFFTNYAGHGYGLSLMRYYAAEKLEAGRDLIAIPGACGSTSVLQWLGLITGTGDDLYGDLTARVNLALSQPGTNQIIGITMHLLESDITIARKPTDPNHSLMPDAATFEARMLDFIDQLRTDFGGSVPISFGLATAAWLSGDATKTAFENVVRDLPNQRSNCFVIETHDLPDNSVIDIAQNNIHFCAQAHETLAVRHYRALFSAASPANLLQNSDFTSWSSGTTFSLTGGVPCAVADDWVACRPAHGEMTVDQSAAIGGGVYSLAQQRMSGTTHTNYTSLFQRFQDADVPALAGCPITVSFWAEPGADFSGTNSRVNVVLYTAALGTFDYLTFLFQTTTTASGALSSTIVNAPARYFVTYWLPATAAVAELRLYWTPSGTAGADDSVTLSMVEACVGVVPR